MQADVFRLFFLSFCFFNDTATTEIYTLSYTTLFRSGAAPPAPASNGRAGPVRRCATRAPGPRSATAAAPGSPCRSEEHTSELQSRLHLVCRLLLEKKKQSLNPKLFSYRIFKFSLECF